MSILFPASIDSLTNPTAANTLASPAHHTQHSDANTAIIALETKVGVDSSAVTTSHDYKLSGVTGSDKAVSKTGSETLTNKTLTSPVVNVGSDATGDMFYRNSGGAIARLPIGTAGQILDVSSGGLPEFINNPAASNGSTTVKGVFEQATTAEINAGTATGATGAVLTVSPDQLAASNFIKNIKVLTGTRAGDQASGTDNYAHGLGVIPRFVYIIGNKSFSNIQAHGDLMYDGTNAKGQYWVILASTSGGAAGTSLLVISDTADISVNQQAAVTFDATNVILTWTKVGSPNSTTINILMMVAG